MKFSVVFVRCFNNTLFRLFKLARGRFKAPLKEGEARPADLESLFFDAEVFCFHFIKFYFPEK